MTQPETRIVRAIVLELAGDRKGNPGRGVLLYNLHGSATSGRGRPDLLGCLPGGQLVGIEVKTPRGASTAIQRKHVRELRSRGARAGFASSVSEAVDICFGSGLGGVRFEASGDD